MNRSRYVTRSIDDTDRSIISILFENGRIAIKEIADRIGMSSPSVKDRILKLQDAGAIQANTIVVEPKVFGLGIAAHVRVRANRGQVTRVKQMLIDTPAVVEADHVSGDDCFMARVLVRDVEDLAALVDRFSLFAATDASVILSPTVARRLPRL